MIYGNLSTEYYNIVKPKFFPEEIRFYQKVLEDTQGLILYGMCGSGRLLLPLLQNGLNIEGLDASQYMLDKCRELGEKIGLHPVLHKQSIDTMSIEKKYDVIMIVGGSFQLISPREKSTNTLLLANRHLNEHGRLLIDTFIPWEFLYENGEKEQFKDIVKTESGALISLTRSSVANKYKQYFISQNKYQKLIDGQIAKIENKKMIVLWYYHYELILLLQSVGFGKIKAHKKKLGKHPELTVYEAIKIRNNITL